MPRRKPRSPLEEATAVHHAFEKLIRIHRGNFLEAMVEEMEADERAARAGDYQNLTRDAEKATDRAYRDAMDRGYNPNTLESVA